MLRPLAFNYMRVVCIITATCQIVESRNAQLLYSHDSSLSSLPTRILSE